MIEVVFGKAEQEKFLDWYVENFERDEDRKYEEQSVSIEKNENEVLFKLKDPYGELVFNKEILLELLK